MRMRVLGLGLVVAGCGVTFAENHPRTLLLGQSYQPQAVRDAVARAMRHKRIEPRGEQDASTLAVSTRSGAACAYAVATSDHSVVIQVAPEGKNPAPSPTQIDDRCLKEAEGLAKAIEKEVERPARLAAREERRRQEHELAVERARQGAAQAELAARALAAQEAEAPPPAVEVAQVPAEAPAAPTPAPPIVESRTNITTRIVQQAPPPEPPPPNIKPLLCCRGGSPYVCPNVLVYSAACLKNPAELPRLCKLDPPQQRYCH